MNDPIFFRYKNHRGEVVVRNVTVDSIEFIRDPGYGHQSGWYVSGYCHEKKARRSFALVNIIIADYDQLTPRFFKLLELPAYEPKEHD